MGTPIVSIMEWNGDSVKTDKSSSIIRFKGADDPVVNALNTLTIPTSGRTFSFEKWLRLRIGTGDPSQLLSNIKFYTDGSSGFGAGVTLYGEISPTGLFRSACNPSTSNTPPNGGSGSRTMTNVFVYTAAGGLSLTSAAETFSGTSTDVGNYVVLCMGVVPGAAGGTLAAETLSFSFDTAAAPIVTATNTLSSSLNAAVAKTFTTTANFDGLMGEASADGPFTLLVGAETEILYDELLGNDFDVVDHDTSISGSIIVTAVTGVVNGSASLAGTSVLFTPLVSGTAAFHYIVSFNGAIDTGSVAITAVDFEDAALLLPLYTLTGVGPVINQRAGTTRATGLDINRQIVSYGSGEERFTATIDTGMALGLLIEDTGDQVLVNSALTGAVTDTPTGWAAKSDGTRSATASLLGFADGATAWVLKSDSITNGGTIGGRPFLAPSAALPLFSVSQTFVQSMIVEFYTGAQTQQLMAIAGLGSTTGSFAATGAQISSVPQYLRMTYMNIASATTLITGTPRYGLGVSSSTSGTLIMSRPSLERKVGRLSYSPDANRSPDMPIVSVGPTFPFSTAAGSFLIQATTPNAPSGSQILAQLDAGSAGNMHQFFQNTSGDMIYKIVKDGVQQSRLAWPPLGNNVTFRLQASYVDNDVRMIIGDATAGLSTSVASMPLGLSILRLGHDISGNQWNSTIAEFNVYRSVADVPSGSATASAGSGGGGPTTSAANTPSSFYGAGHQATSLFNSNQMKIAGGQVATSFLCRKNATVRGIKFYNIWATQTDPAANYSNYLGNNSLPGGLTRVRIFKNNPTAGSGGTAANVPSTVIPGDSGGSGGASFRIIDCHAELTSPAVNFPESSGSCNLSSSVIYHLLWDNVHSNPTSNYTEIDQIKPNSSTTATGPSGRKPHNPSIADVYDAVQFRVTGVNTWTRYNQTGLYQLRFADGTFQGQGYMEVDITTHSPPDPKDDEGYVPVGGTTQVRQTMMPHETVTLSQINVVVKSNTIPSGSLIATTRQQSNGAVMDTTTVAPTLIKSAGNADWLSSPVNLRSAPLILSGSKTYTVTFVNAGSGSWGIGGLRDGSVGLSKAGPSGSFSSMTTIEGRAEKSTNSGGSWTGFKLNGALDSDAIDLMWYYTRTA